MENIIGIASQAVRATAWIVAALLFVAPGAIFAQGLSGPVAVLRTGDGPPLVSSIQAMGSFSESAPMSFQFAFSFSTDKEPAPTLFPDAITVPLAEAKGADLFNNQNGINSMAWISITPVPEPSTWALLVTALVFFFAFQWSKD